MHYGKLKNGHLAAIIDNTIIGLVEAGSRLGKSLPATDLYSLIEAGREAQKATEELARAAFEQNVACQAYTDQALQTPLGQARRNVFCIGKNYADHAAEIARKLDAESDLPKHPIVFTKATNTLIGPQDEIPLHTGVTEKIDYEGELAIIIGERCTNVSAADAWQVVFGYSCYNDVSARDLQRRHTQWHIGKSLDGFGPMGPVVTPTYGKALDGKVRLTCAVNDEVRQDATLDLMIFDVPTIIETLSRGITLEPGDVIATGTPAGVGMGFSPSKFLQAGDKVEVAIDGTKPLVNYLSKAQ